jgi:hypothetical protein
LKPDLFHGQVSFSLAQKCAQKNPLFGGSQRPHRIQCGRGHQLL